MWEYLLKSSACLLAFYLFYTYVLEHQGFHSFKRFYLLGTSVFAFLIPLLILPEAVPSADLTAGSLQQVVFTGSEPRMQPEPGLMLSEHWEITLYLGGLLLFIFLFIRNLSVLLQTIWRYPREVYKHHTKVLISEPIIPHSFFRYLFLNRKELAENKIPKEVILHEEQHILQYHSLDILLLEFFKTILWFNPLLWLYLKKARLNHEFLADRGVIQKGTPIKLYQQSLLRFSQPKNQPAFAHAINYSSIKKRMEIMKTTNSKKRYSWRTFLLLPLTALLLYGFSGRESSFNPTPEDGAIKKTDTRMPEGNPIVPGISQDGATKAQIQEYNKLARKYNGMEEDEMIIDKREVQRMHELYSIMSQQQRKKAEPFPNLPPPPPAPEAASKPSRRPIPPAPLTPEAPPKPPKPERPDVQSKLRPTPPPPPPNPVRHVKELIEEGAVFHYQGEEISEKAALKLVQAGNVEYIKVDKKGLGPPEVWLK